MQDIVNVIIEGVLCRGIDPGYCQVALSKVCCPEGYGPGGGGALSGETVLLYCADVNEFQWRWNTVKETAWNTSNSSKMFYE